MDKPKCWVKNVIKKCTGESESWVIILNVIFNICVCPYFTQFWVKTTQHCLDCAYYNESHLF